MFTIKNINKYFILLNQFSPRAYGQSSPDVIQSASVQSAVKHHTDLEFKFYKDQKICVQGFYPDISWNIGRNAVDYNVVATSFWSFGFKAKSRRGSVRRRLPLPSLCPGSTSDRPTTTPGSLLKYQIQLSPKLRHRTPIIWAPFEVTTVLKPSKGHEL